MIVLQDRDRKILKLCYEQQFILTEHSEWFFRGGSYQACCMRLGELVQNRYLKKDTSATIGKKTIYRLTSLGVETALESGATAIASGGRLQPANMVHDSIVTSVRQRLEEFWDAKFVCERAIKESEYRQIPDGIFFFPSGKGIAIEVENSDKGRSRFIRLMNRWKDVKQIILVLYVVTSDSLFHTIQRYLEQAPKEQPMGLVHWSALSTSKPKVWTPRGEIAPFERRQF